MRPNPTKGLTLILLFSSVLSDARETRVPTMVSCLLGGFAYIFDSERTGEAKAFFLYFKNHPQFREWLKQREGNDVLLDHFQTGDGQALIREYESSGFSGRTKSRELDLTASGDDRLRQTVPDRRGRTISALRTPQTGRYEGSKPPEMIAYENQVLNLTSGDRVKATSGKTGRTRTFLIQQFIGAGNTSHIWTEVGEPHYVLKIPFVTADAMTAGRNSPGGWRLKSIDVARDFFRRLIAKEPAFRTAISQAATKCQAENPQGPVPEMLKMRDYGKNGEFVEMERAHPEYDGREWLGRIWAQGETRLGGDPAEIIKARSLILAIESLQASGLIEKRPTNIFQWRNYYVDEARQFAWDANKGTWVLMDWE